VRRKSKKTCFERKKKKKRLHARLGRGRGHRAGGYEQKLELGECVFRGETKGLGGGKGGGSAATFAKRQGHLEKKRSYRGEGGGVLAKRTNAKCGNPGAYYRDLFGKKKDVTSTKNGDQHSQQKRKKGDPPKHQRELENQL